jgi:hypothetical protein
VFVATGPPATVNPAAQPPIAEAAVADDEFVDDEDRELAETTEHEADTMCLNRLSIAPPDAASRNVLPSQKARDAGGRWLFDGVAMMLEL